MSTIGASTNDDPCVQQQTLRKRGEQSDAAQSDTALQLFRPTSSEGGNPPASMAESA